MSAKNVIKSNNDNKVFAEVGKWFMDIAKYVTTVGIIAAILGRYRDNDMRAFLIVGGVIIAVTLIIGLLFIKFSSNLKK
jgi:hypothetical protein